MLHIKFFFDWPSGFRGEYVKILMTTTKDAAKINFGTRNHTILHLDPHYKVKVLCLSIDNVQISMHLDDH